MGHDDKRLGISTTSKSAGWPLPSHSNRTCVSGVNTFSPQILAQNAAREVERWPLELEAKPADPNSLFAESVLHLIRSSRPRRRGRR
jgi:hypothetical protein